MNFVNKKHNSEKEIDFSEFDEKKSKVNLSKLSVGVLVVIMFSMIGWGLVDAFKNRDIGYVASVGNMYISQEELEKGVDNFIGTLSVDLRNSVDKDLVGKIVFSDIVRNKMIDQEMKAFGFSPSNAVLIDFLKTFYKDKINSAEISIELLEKNVNNKNDLFIKSLFDIAKRDVFIKSIMPIFSSSSGMSDELIEIVFNSKKEKRVYDVIEFDSASIGEISSPSTDDLMNIYHENNPFFMNKEHRVVSYFSSKDLEDLLKFKDLQGYNKNNSVACERRDVDLFVFKNKGDANKFMFYVKKHGSNLDAFLKDFPDAKHYSLDGIGVGDLEEAVSNLAFSTPIGRFTSVVSTKNGFVVALSKKVRLAEGGLCLSSNIGTGVKAKCKKAMILRDKVRDMISEGMSIKEISKSFGITPKEHLFYKGESENNALFDSQLNRVIDNAEAGYFDIKENPETCQILFFVVDSVIPSKKKNFENVKHYVVDIFNQRQKDKALREVATSFVNALMKKNARVREVLESNPVFFKTKRKSGSLDFYDINSGSVPSDSPLVRMFEIEKGDFVGPVKTSNESYSVFILKDILPSNSPVDTNIKDKFIQKLNENRGVEYSHFYRGYLKRKYPVKIFGEYKKVLNDSDA